MSPARGVTFSQKVGVSLPLPIPFPSLSLHLPAATLPPLKGKGSPYSVTERRVPELIPVLGSQPAGDVSHKPGGTLLKARVTAGLAESNGSLPPGL